MSGISTVISTVWNTINTVVTNTVNGIKTVIIPAANEKDVEEFSQTVKNGIRFVPVKTIDEVFRVAFAEPPKPIKKENENETKKNSSESNETKSAKSEDEKPSQDEVQKNEV